MKKGKKYARAKGVATRAGRPPVDGYCSMLSDWEVDEARLDNRRGVPVDALAERYGVSAKTLQRAFKRMDERKGAIA